MENISQRLLPRRSLQKLRYQLVQLGWQGWLGLFLLFASTVIGMAYLPSKTQQLRALQSSYKTLNAQLAADNKNTRRVQHFDLVQSFTAFLPQQSAANSKISAVLRAAHQAGLAVDKVEYSQSNASPQLVQYHIQLPLNGTYREIRQFLNQVFNTLPAVALSELSLGRGDVTSERLDARVGFTLYLAKPDVNKPLLNRPPLKSPYLISPQEHTHVD